MATLRTEVPRAFQPLLRRSRYKAARGGRGGAKSHFFAERVILACYEKKTRVVCIREVQNSLKESVRQLLIDKIQKLGLGQAFDVLESEIRGLEGTPAAGSLIVFKGMQSYNAENIKSLEDFDIAWVEEAQTFSERSLRLLRPTIRKDGSELWFSWNTRYETDAVDKFFFGDKPPADSIIIQVNWYDNPWFNEVLKAEKDQDYASDPEMAEHVWGGGYERVTAGAYFAKQVAAAEREGRVGHYPHIMGNEVYTGWDIGVDDYTAIWFFQIRQLGNMPRVRIIDYYECDGLGADEIIPSIMPEYTVDLQDRVSAMIEIDREDKFKYQRHFFPHDIGVREWGNGAKQRVQTVNELGVPLWQIHRGVAANPEDRINASRQLLPICEFNQTKRVMLGLARLRRYSRKLNENLGLYLGPAKDGNDHGADAFGEFAINCGITIPKPEPEQRQPEVPQGKFRPPPVQEPSGRRIRL
jgi:phage terminase large subunit